jgi:hypothetical protein
MQTVHVQVQFYTWHFMISCIVVDVSLCRCVVVMLCRIVTIKMCSNSLLLLLLLQVLLWPCHGGNNQQFERLADGSLRFSGEAPRQSTLVQRFLSRV